MVGARVKQRNQLCFHFLNQTTAHQRALKADCHQVTAPVAAPVAQNSPRSPHQKRCNSRQSLLFTARQKINARTNVADARVSFLSRQESFQELRSHVFFPLEFSYRTPIPWNISLAFPMNQRLGKEKFLRNVNPTKFLCPSYEPKGA